MKAPLLKAIIDSGQLDPNLQEEAKQALADEDPDAAAEVKRTEEAGDLEMLKAAADEKMVELRGAVDKAREIADKIPEAEPNATEAAEALAEAEAAAEEVATAEDLEVAQEAKSRFDEAAMKVEDACAECKKAVPGQEEAPDSEPVPEGGNPETPAPEPANGLGMWANKMAE